MSVISKDDFLATDDGTSLKFFSDRITGDDSSIVHQAGDVKIDWTMAIQRVIVHKIIDYWRSKITLSEGARLQTLDIGSAFEMITYLMSFSDVSMLEPRWPDNLRLNISEVGSLASFKGEAQSLPFENDRFDLITCLHAMEHFGLGRYGDTLDAQGDVRGLTEFKRVLYPDGRIILSVPSAKVSRLDWPSQRVYSPEHIRSIASSVGLTVDFLMITYSVGHPHGICIGPGKEDLDAWPVEWTPPVLITVLKK